MIYGDGFDTFAAPTVDEATGEIIESEAENKPSDERTKASDKSAVKSAKVPTDGEKQGNEAVSSFFDD